MEILKWMQNWYDSYCDGYWEHDNQIKIETLDNPGWDISIDLAETILEGKLNIEWKLHEESESDWYGISVKDNIYQASGDPSKLEFLLQKFRELVEEHST